jgi:diaminohydroxyphosphoribosylaminopyrimidine deaminase/5-amino-6-(5-phosphoribosylamino)uracil reductase
MTADEKFLRQTFKLAKKGAGRVSPNPMVGAIIVKNGKIIGSGYHKSFGDWHAEINALNQAQEKAKGATLYANLEPCAHFGKTPPCVNAIIKAGIKKVIFSSIDPNPLVNGKGRMALKKAGIKVKYGLLEKEAIKLNETYFKFIQTKIPFVIMKVAQTLDGRIAAKTGHSHWISGEDSRKLVHTLRSQVDAVLVGIDTVLKDNPQLTVRMVKGKNPKRIVLDSFGLITQNRNLIRENSDGKTIVITTNKEKGKALEKLGLEVWTVQKNRENMVDLKSFLRIAGEKQVTSILVEGGRRVYTSFLKEKLIDKILCFVSPQILGEGIDVVGDLRIKKISQAITLKEIEFQPMKNDFLVIGYPEWSK